MKVKLICNAKIKILLEEILRNRNLTTASNADIAIVERGFDPEAGKVSILFDDDSLDSLIGLLDLLSPSKGENGSEQQSVLTVKSERGEYKVISYEDIHYFEALGKEVFCSNGREKFKIKEKLFILEEILKDFGFVRVSKSFVVNIKSIDRIVPWFNSTLILKMNLAQPDITVTRSYVNQFKNYLNM